mgnify:CR=1 FL=1
MKFTEEKTYFIYVVLGSFYFISKVIYYLCGSVCLPRVILGLVASRLTYKGNEKEFSLHKC